MSNARRRPRRWGASLVLLAVGLAGCGQSPVTRAVPAVAQAAVAVDMADAGRLEIRLTGLAERHVQATTAQVSTLRVTLTGGSLSAPLVKEVTAAKLSAGKGTVAFEAVPHGVVTVKVEALDAGGENVGTRETSTEVLRGQTAIVPLTLKLVDTHVVSENGNLGLDLTVEDGTVVTDPIASPSPRPSSPALSPAPSTSPSSSAKVAIYGDVDRTWFANGTLKVAGQVKNGLKTAKDVTVTIAFTRAGLLGRKTVETQTLDLGSVAAGARKSFDATSAVSVRSLLGEGDATITVTTP